MSAVHHAMSAYSRAAATMPTLRQIVLLYDAALSRIREAKAAIERGRAPDLVTATSKAAAILEALDAALDHERGGVISANLARLYQDVSFRLQRLNLEPDAHVCDLLAARLLELRGAWAELAGRPPGALGPASEGAPAAPATADESARTVTA